MSRRARQRAGGRKAYTPGPVHTNAWWRAITGAAKLPADDVARVKAGLARAFTEFGCGRECRDHWACMADAMNVAESLANAGICSDDGSRDRIHAAMTVLADVVSRHQAGGSWTLHADERQQLDDGLWLHGIQLEHCSFSEYERAIQDVRNRVSQARAGNAPKGFKVIQGEIGA